MLDWKQPFPLGEVTDPAAVPRGAVDCHAHVIGDPYQFPMAPSRSYTPPEASLDEYMGTLDTLGMDFGVLVQISVHGSDNRLMCSALRAHRTRLRGVAVVPADIGEKDCQSLLDDGVVGLRINALFGAGAPIAEIRRYEDLCHDWGWHLQLLVDATGLDAARGLTKVPVVIDHMGHLHPGEDAALEGQRKLCNLMADGCHVKLSAPYRLTSESEPYEGARALAQTLYEQAPDRCVWGSDWPHVSHAGHISSTGTLLDSFLDWFPSPQDRRRILVENAHGLYGF